MAESESGDGGWWSSMITAAKEKSVAALKVTKRDLAEFVSVLSNDTSTAVQHAGENIKGLIHTETEDRSEETRSTASRHPVPASSSSLGVPYDRSQAQLFSLQSSSDTYLSDPLGVESEYQEWARNFDVQSRQSEISQLLVNCPHVRTIHGQLVPAKVSYETFWQRYFFKLGLLQQEEQRRANLMARVAPQQEDLQWEELEEGEGEGDKEKVEEKEGERSKDHQNRVVEDDLVEVGSSIIEIKSEHVHSESSDSFVCVSEDLPPSEKSHTSPERSHASPEGNGVGEWEYLKIAEVGGGGEEVKGERERGGGEDSCDFGGEKVAKERVGGGEGEGGEEGEGREGKKKEAKGERKEKDSSDSSDWESWDD